MAASIGDSGPYSGEVSPGGPPDTRELAGLIVTKLAVDKEMSNNCYLLRCNETGETLLVDAAGDAATLLGLLGDGRLVGVLETHGHWDHVQALADVVAATSAPVLAHAGDEYPVPVDRLLEDVLDPNRNVDQAFRATLIKTSDDRVISGLVLREEGQLLVVQEAADKETKVPIKDIQQRVLSQLSPMPGNVIDALSEPDFYDLLSYLLQQRGQK